MPLPQQVVEQLSRDTPRTAGWSAGMLLFSGTLLGLTILIYLGLTYGYAPYLNAQIGAANDQIDKLNQSVSADEQAQLATFSSQIVNLRSLTTNHIFFSYFLNWLGANTEANVYYTSLSYASGNQVSLSGVAKTQADLNQQLAIFESSGNVANMSISNMVAVPNSASWTFGVTLTMKQALFLWNANTSTQAAPGSVITLPAMNVTSSSTTTTTP